MVADAPVTGPPDQGASPYGYHFLNEYQQCPRRFALHRIYGLEPAKEKPSLLFGKTWHRLLELILEGTEPEEAVVLVLREHAAAQPRYQKPEDYEKHRGWLKAGLPGWLSEARREGILPGEGSRVLSVEDDFQVPLAAGFRFSCRTDGRLRFPDGRTYLLEHKTTSWSVDGMLNSVDCEDQMTGYLLAQRRAAPTEPCDGVLLDVTTFKPAVPYTTFAVVTRTTEDLVNFELSCIGLFTELRQKELALAAGRPIFELFPRNGAWCGQFGCSYASICRRRLEAVDLSNLDGFTIRRPTTDGPPVD